MVEVSTADGKEILGIFPIVPSYRKSVSNDTIRTSRPGGAGLDRIVSWYFSGSNYGYRFVYSKADLEKISTLAAEPKGGATEAH